MPVDAEGWLAERGVVRESVVGSSRGAPPTTVPPMGVREAVGLARQSASETASEVMGGVTVADVPTSVGDDTGAASVSDPGDVDAALAFIRRSTANAPQSEGRLRTKLRDRGYDDRATEEALARARGERLVDDEVLLDVLVAERRARGHADARLRRDLRDRGFLGEQVDAALGRAGSTDPGAAAFDVARAYAARQRAVEAEVAVRRTVGALVRRGHPEALARKAARDAVYADRDPRGAAER